MKNWLLIWAGLRRKPSRTLLIFLSAAVAFLLYGLLEGARQGVEALGANSQAHRLWVVRKGGGDTLPLAHLGKIERVPGVEAAAAVTPLRTYFREPRYQVFGLATDPAAFFEVFPELEVDPAALSAMRTTRHGLLVGKALADIFKWQPGARVSLGSSWLKADGTNHWEFEIVGIFNVRSDASADVMATAVTYRALANYPYLDEARAFHKGTVAQYFVGTDGEANAAQVGLAIDGVFANSAGETLTHSEAIGLSGRIKQLADLRVIVTGICGAALFSLLLLAANTMMQSVHERISEIGVLKTLGYKDGTIFGLLVSETFVVFLLAAMLGLVLAWYYVPSATTGFGLSVTMPPIVLVWGLSIAAVSAIACALLPALRARRTTITDALLSR